MDTPDTITVKGSVVAALAVNPQGLETIGELATHLRSVLDGIDAMDRAIYTNLKKRKEDLKGEILRRMGAAGLEKLTAGGISLGVKATATVLIDAEKWSDICEGMVEHGLGHCFYRKISAAKLSEEFVQGKPIPDGLTLSTMATLSTRRVG